MQNVARYSSNPLPAATAAHGLYVCQDSPGAVGGVVGIVVAHGLNNDRAGIQDVGKVIQTEAARV